MDQRSFAAALLNAKLPMPDGVTSARGEADASRFAIYRNNVVVGLTNALGQRFPVVKRLVGDDFFQGMAKAFMATCLPKSPLIFAYGDEFADFIAGFAPAAALPYLADVARLEAAWTRAYHAGDVLPMKTEALLRIPNDRIGATRLMPHAAAAMLSSDYTIGTIWQAHQDEDPGTVSVSKREWVAVTRPAFEVRLHVVPEADGVFGLELLSGSTIEDASNTALAQHSAFDFGSAIVGLASIGLFAGIAPQGRTPT